MKINEVILEAWINLPPDKKAEEDKAADQEFRALKGIDSPDSQKLADAVRSAYAITGTVDSAYELARSMVKKQGVPDLELGKMDKRRSVYVSANKSKGQAGKKQSWQKSASGPKTSDDGTGTSRPGRGQYTQYKDGSDRAAAPKSKTQQAIQGIEKWASDSFGDLPGAGLVKGAYNLGKGAVNVATAPARAVAKDLGTGYNFLRDPSAFDTFKRSRTKRR